MQTLGKTVQWLAELTQVIQSIGNPWQLTMVCIVVLLVGIRSGIFYTPSSRISEAMASDDYWLILRFTTGEVVKNSVFYGLQTLIAVMWDKWWLTGPLGLLIAVMVLPTILQDVLIAVGTLPAIVVNPRSLVPIVASTVVRLAGDALTLLYLGLIFTALLT